MGKYTKCRGRTTWSRAAKWLIVTSIALLIGLGIMGSASQKYVSASDVTMETSSHDAYLKALNPAWVNSDYAAKIPVDAKGIDPETHNAYIDEWMPDKNFQQLVIKNLQDANSNLDLKPQNVNKVQDITKKNVANLYRFYGAPSYEASKYYQIQMDTKSVEGLQYAKGLINFDMGNELNANINNGKPPFTWATLTDISALATLDKLEDVNVQFTNVSDISALANKPELGQLSMSYDHITDVSPLKDSPKLDSYTPAGFQFVRGSTIKINPNSGAAVTTDDNVRDLNNQPVTLKPYRGASAGDLPFTNFYTNYISTATGTNISASQNQWKDFKGSSGYLTTWWEDPFLGNKSYTFFGVIIHPYILDTTLAAPVTIHYQDTDGDKIADDVVLDNGKIGDEYNTTPKVIDGYTFKEVEGNANGTYTMTPQTVTYVYTKNPVELNYTVKTVDQDRKDLGHGYTAKGKTGDVIKAPEIDNYLVRKPAQVTLDSDNQVITFVYDQNVPSAQPAITVKYQDANGIDLQSPTISKGDVGTDYTAPKAPATLTFNGETYKYVGIKDNQTLPTKFGDHDQTFIYLYQKTSTGGGTTPIVPTTPPVIPTTPITPAKPTTPSTPIIPANPIAPIGPNIAKKGEVVYAIKKVYLYKNATFKKSQRVASYDKKPRINRPMFVVTDYTKSSNGRLRYKVRDVNHVTKNKYRTGYLTTNSKFVVPVYYQSKPKVITVINPKGVNAYYNKNLTRKVKNYKQGTVLKVKRLVRHNLTTRFILTNGRHITANRKLVITGKYKAAKVVQAKGAINRYSNANLTKKNKHYTKQTKKVFKVKRWEYSHTNSTKKHGALRYQVAGGYITGNAKYVRVVIK